MKTTTKKNNVFYCGRRWKATGLDEFTITVFLTSIMIFVSSLLFASIMDAFVLPVYAKVNETAIVETIEIVEEEEIFESEIVETIVPEAVIPEVIIPEEPIIEEIIPYTEYTIKSGDTLWDISKEFYGSGNHYTWIEKCNNLYGSNRKLIRNHIIRLYPLDYDITEEEIEINGYLKSISMRSPYLDIPVDVDTSSMEYIGNIHVTGYDPLCKHCCGKNDGITASGEYADYYKTVAMNNIPLGTEIYIEGYGFFRVNDRGGKSLGIDIACESHNTAYVMSSPGADVYIVKEVA